MKEVQVMHSVSERKEAADHGSRGSIAAEIWQLLCGLCVKRYGKKLSWTSILIAIWLFSAGL